MNNNTELEALRYACIKALELLKDGDAEPQDADRVTALLEAVLKGDSLANKAYTVWCGGFEANNHLMSFNQAQRLAKQYIKLGYDDVNIERVTT